MWGYQPYLWWHIWKKQRYRLDMDIKNINLDLLTEEKLRDVESGGIGFLLVCFAAGMTIGLCIV